MHACSSKQGAKGWLCDAIEGPTCVSSSSRRASRPAGAGCTSIRPSRLKSRPPGRTRGPARPWGRQNNVKMARPVCLASLRPRSPAFHQASLQLMQRLEGAAGSLVLLNTACEGLKIRWHAEAALRPLAGAVSCRQCRRVQLLPPIAPNVVRMDGSKMYHWLRHVTPCCMMPVLLMTDCLPEQLPRPGK